LSIRKEDYVAGGEQSRVSGLGLISRAPVDLLDADVGKAVEIHRRPRRITKSVKDCTLPSTRNIVLAGESYAYHEDICTCAGGPLSNPTRRRLQNGAT